MNIYAASYMQQLRLNPRQTCIPLVGGLHTTAGYVLKQQVLSGCYASGHILQHIHVCVIAYTSISTFSAASNRQLSLLRQLEHMSQSTKPTPTCPITHHNASIQLISWQRNTALDCSRLSSQNTVCPASCMVTDSMTILGTMYACLLLAQHDALHDS
jgi:hypothetical protein